MPTRMCNIEHSIKSVPKNISLTDPAAQKNGEMVDADDRKSRTNTHIKRGTGAITLQFRRSLPSKRQAAAFETEFFNRIGR